MQTEHAFARDEVYPSWFANALGHFLSLGAFGFVITKQDATHIQVVAGADDLAAAIAISGRWRWNEATVTRTHPGGAASTYDIYVTAADNDIEAMPAPYTDTTNYGFALAIVAAGATPAIVPGTVDIYRHVGSLQWDGAQITRVDQTLPAVHNHAFTHHTGQPDALAPADIGAVATAGAGSLASLELTGAGTALTVDHDAAVDGVLAVAGNQTIGGTLVLTGNATLNGTLLVAGASTFDGLITGQGGLTLDAGAGSVGQTLTLTGRQAGAANPASIAVTTVGGLTYNVPGGQSHAFNVAGGAVATISAVALQIPAASQLQISGDTNLYRVAASNAGVVTLRTDNTGLGVAGLGVRVVADNDVKLRSNYLPGPDRLKTAAQSSWSVGIGDGANDDVHVSYTAATAGAPIYTRYLMVSNAGQLQLPIAGAAGGLLIGGDATLYRNAAGSLRTSGALVVDGNTTIGGTLAVTGGVSYVAKVGAAAQMNQVAANQILANKLLAADAQNAFQIGGDGKLSWGPGGATALDANTNLYRSGLNTLRTDGTLVVGALSSTMSFLNVVAEIGGVQGASNGVALRENNAHMVTMAWTGSILQFTLDGTTNVGTSSDERLKKNIRPVEDGALDLVRALKPIRFQWAVEPYDDREHVGFSAQQVQRVLPHAVDEIGGPDIEEPSLVINERHIVALLVGSVRELSDRLDKLTGRTQGVK